MSLGVGRHGALSAELAEWLEDVAESGIGSRVVGLGGSITTGHPRNGHFRLEASLPCGAAAAPPGPGQAGTGVSAETPAP